MNADIERKLEVMKENQSKALHLSYKVAALASAVETVCNEERLSEFDDGERMVLTQLLVDHARKLVERLDNLHNDNDDVAEVEA